MAVLFKGRTAMGLEDEKQKLRKADTDIEAVDKRIQHHTEIIFEMAREGHAVEMALERLTSMRETRRALLHLRALIVDEINRLRTDAPESAIRLFRQK
jgi:hypothetical protein